MAPEPPVDKIDDVTNGGESIERGVNDTSVELDSFEPDINQGGSSPGLDDNDVFFENAGTDPSPFQR